MTLDQLSTAIDAWVWIDQQITTFGPGVALWALGYTGLAVTKRIFRQLRDASHHIDHLLTPVDDQPADTQPGTDDDLLNHCQAAWKAQPATRKEKP